MKKIYMIFAVAMTLVLATGCERDNEETSLDRLDRLYLNDVTFISNTKLHLDLVNLNRLLYDDGDAILVNNKLFSLQKGESNWTAISSDNTSVDCESDGLFYIAYGGTTTYFYYYDNVYYYDISNNIASYNTTPSNPTTGIVLASTTNNNNVTLKPCCAVIRLDNDGEDYDYVNIGFQYFSSNDQIVKQGELSPADGKFVTCYNPLRSVNNGTGDFLSMKRGTDAYYVGVPMLGDDVNAKVYIYAYKNGNVTQQITEGFVTIQKGKVYSIKLSDGAYAQFFDQYGRMTKGVFTVGTNRSVKFSRGNLQYSTVTGWHFADHQYDAMVQYNSNISATNADYIDLFGWGTSGYDNKYPYMSSGDDDDYYSGSIASTNYDWGVYASIDNGQGYGVVTWRTLTASEWNYLINSRQNASSKCALATVNGFKGMILLPDIFTDPYAGTNKEFTSGTGNGYTTNNYSAIEWDNMELEGAVFLPITGYRWETDVYDYTTAGYYWSATREANGDVQWINFNSSSINDFNSGYHFPSDGLAVRLVTNYIN